MQGFIVVAFFAVGCVAGWLGLFPASLTDGDFSMYVLYALMIQVGMSIGSDKKLKEILCSLRPKLLLLPLGTIVGTLIFVAAASPFIGGIILPDSLAVGAGFGYYSLSSVLITQIKEASAGASFAAQLGTVALMANIMREVITLLFAPAICRVFGKLAPISTGGATSMDSTLPVITSVCGKEMVFISIFHGVLVDFSVPFLVTFFASL
ncbi:MAG: lysine exporter LysO family protein [Bacteroidales bacterium]|nr:lysine exporter LysO family protein [Bacteroidales bacterium]